MKRGRAAAAFVFFARVRIAIHSRNWARAKYFNARRAREMGADYSQAGSESA